jgi:hypothetical protein
MLVARAGGRNLEHDIKIIFAVQVCWPPCCDLSVHRAEFR